MKRLFSWRAFDIILTTLLVVGASMTTTLDAFAVLGEGPDSIDMDSAVFQAKRRIVTPQGGSSNYVIHELGFGPTAVREFVSSDGRVFAITWRGLAHPNLSMLLGSYFLEYQDWARGNRSRAGRAPTTARTARMILQKSGHFRDVRGKAYLPEALPVGFDLSDLSP